MANNKVVYGNSTIMDITDTTATASDVANGKVFYANSGVRTTGTGDYMNKVSNPTADDILTTDANGQAQDSGVSINDVAMAADLDGKLDKTGDTVEQFSLVTTGGEIIIYDSSAGNVGDIGIMSDNGAVHIGSGNNQGIVAGLASPALAHDAANKDYVDTRVGSKANLVPSAVNGEVLITDAQGQPQSSGTDLAILLNDVEAGKEAFMLKDFNQQINLTIPPVTQDIANTSIPNMDVDLNEIDPTGELNTKYAIAGLVKYEIYDATSGGNRLNAFPVCSFSMNGQRTLRLRCMVGGPNSKTARRISGALLLKHR